MGWLTWVAIAAFLGYAKSQQAKVAATVPENQPETPTIARTLPVLVLPSGAIKEANFAAGVITYTSIGATEVKLIGVDGTVLDIDKSGLLGVLHIPPGAVADHILLHGDGGESRLDLYAMQLQANAQEVLFKGLNAPKPVPVN
jgi:hypothetical protein